MRRISSPRHPHLSTLQPCSTQQRSLQPCFHSTPFIPQRPSFYTTPRYIASHATTHHITTQHAGTNIVRCWEPPNSSTAVNPPSSSSSPLSWRPPFASLFPPPPAAIRSDPVQNQSNRQTERDNKSVDQSHGVSEIEITAINKSIEDESDGAR